MMRPAAVRPDAAVMRPEAGPQDPTAAELAQARAERDRAVQELSRVEAERHAVRRSRTRTVLAGVLVVLFAVLLPLTVAATWAHRTVLDTSTYVSTVKPIASDPAVTAAVSRDITNQLYTALDPQAVIAAALPPKAAFLAGPVAIAAKSQVQDAVQRVLSSDRFQQLWENANRTAHTQLVKVLRGDSDVLRTTDGQVVLNLVPLLNDALKNATDLVSGVVGKTVTLPAITSDDVPSQACVKISAALDRPLPTTCGQVALFPAKNLQSARRAVQVFDRAVLAMLIVTPVVFIAALWASQRRRRTLLQLTIGSMVGLIVVRRVLYWEQDRLIDAARPGNKDARGAIVHGILNGFFDLTAWFLVGGLVLVALALVTGPYRWAVATRRGLATSGRLAVVAAKDSAATADPKDQPALAWVRAHLDALRIGGIVLAGVVVLAFGLGFWWFLAVAAVLVVFELGLHRLRPPTVITLPDAPVPHQA
jgi:hypothetical protein